MFVSVILDPGGIDSARLLISLLTNTGFRKIQRACWENMNMTENDLAGLKKEIDRITDYYDTVRIYQFPIDGMFVITELKQKKWRRCPMKISEKSAKASKNPQRPAGASRSGPAQNGAGKVSRPAQAQSGKATK